MQEYQLIVKSPKARVTTVLMQGSLEKCQHHFDRLKLNMPPVGDNKREIVKVKNWKSW